MFSALIITQSLHTFTCHISDSKKRRLRSGTSLNQRHTCKITARIHYQCAFCHTLSDSSATRTGNKGCRFPPPYCRQPAACSTPCLHANPAAAVTRVHVVSVLTRSHLSRCIQPVKGLRCGLRRRPCALRFPPGFCGGTAQEGAAYQRGVCLCPVLFWVTACR